jgi:hypothetical protein
MGSTTHSIEVNAPLRAVYNQWTQFEEFPRFMEGVDEVRQDGPNRLFWRAKIGGKEKQWEAEITEQVPDKKIAWVSIDGTRNAGEVSFESLETERTLITLTMEYQPEGLLEMAGDVLGIPSGRVEEDLNLFRDFIEQSGKETGSWRGRIRGGEISDSNATAVSHEESQRVGDVDERTAGEFPAPKSELEAQRIPARKDETFDSREHASSIIDKPIPLTVERSGDQSEIIAPDGIATEKMEGKPGKSWQSREQLDEPPLAAEHLGEQNNLESDRIPTERDESFETVALHEEGGAAQMHREWVGVVVPSEEEIAHRAYQLYLDHGQVPGHEEEHWLQAQRELSVKTERA